jgi:hypothetical protein
MREDSDDTNAPWTMNVVEAGRKYYGLGRDASYHAARQGLIPTIRINGKVRALPSVIERQLNGEKNAAR